MAKRKREQSPSESQEKEHLHTPPSIVPSINRFSVSQQKDSSLLNWSIYGAGQGKSSHRDQRIEQICSHIEIS
ncbi:hypothetical protein BLOT_001783 [Blomia tropicalis]|nr:hypothetical protein BLOT_001783 [Blomia tropicalis]